MNMRVEVCPRCKSRVPRRFGYCPTCGARIDTEDSRPDDDFIIWEGPVYDPTYRSDYKDNQFQKKDPYSVSNSTRSGYEVCKCLGTIEGVPCGTYYFESSIRRHGGCARRDCSNSFENRREVVVGKETREVIERENEHVGLRITLAIVGFIFLILGSITLFPASVILGVAVFLLALLPYGSKKQEEKVVDFQIVNVSEINPDTRDPWTQQKILEVILT
jgi:hypothetical protein